MEEINLKELFIYFVDNLKSIIIFTVLGVLAGYIYTYYIQVPKYSSNTTLLLTQTNETMTQNDLSINQKLVTTYREIVKSKRVLNQVIEILDLKYSMSVLALNVSVSSVKDTEIIQITVTDYNRALASDIANSIAEVFSKEIAELYNLENIGIVDMAEPSKSPYNVNAVKQIVLVTICGIMLGLTIIFIKYYFDTTIKSPEQVERILEGVPVLGLIPRRDNSKESAKK